MLRTFSFLLLLCAGFFSPKLQIVESSCRQAALGRLAKTRRLQQAPPPGADTDLLQALQSIQGTLPSPGIPSDTGGSADAGAAVGAASADGQRQTLGPCTDPALLSSTMSTFCRVRPRRACSSFIACYCDASPPPLQCTCSAVPRPNLGHAAMPAGAPPLPPFPSLPPWINWPPCSKTRCRSAAASPPPRCSRAAGIPAPLRRRWRSKSRCAAALPRCPRVRAAPGDSQLLHPIVSAGKNSRCAEPADGPALRRRRCSGSGGPSASSAHR